MWPGAPPAEFAIYEPSARQRSPPLAELRLATPEQRIEADVGLGRHADVVGERKALVDFRDGQDAGSDAGRRRFARSERLRRRRARSPMDKHQK
jgi:hypothetical protein